MITFIIALLVLIGGYFLYGSYVEHLFSPDKNKKTPALTMEDGVDFIPLPTWKIFMIQFLNIAGLGPIFGAIMGAKFGTASYLWIVLGTIFAGAVHDYLSGMLSLRHNGSDDIGRGCVCCRTCRFVGQANTRLYGRNLLDYYCFHLLYVGYPAAGR